MRIAHPIDGRARTHFLGEVESVIRLEQAPGAGPLPFVRIAEALAHRLANLGGLAGARPDNRVGAGDVRELETVDAGGRLGGRLRRGIVERRHVGRATDLLGGRIGITSQVHARPALLGRHGVPADRGVPLPDIARSREDFPDPLHLRVTQAMDLAELAEKLFVGLLEDRLGETGPGRKSSRDEHHCETTQHDGPSLRSR